MNDRAKRIFRGVATVTLVLLILPLVTHAMKRERQYKECVVLPHGLVIGYKALIDPNRSTPGERINMRFIDGEPLFDGSFEGYPHYFHFPIRPFGEGQRASLLLEKRRLIPTMPSGLIGFIGLMSVLSSNMMTPHFTTN